MAEEIAKEGFYLVKSLLCHCYYQGWRFLTLEEGYGVDGATWESCSAFLLPDGRLNFVVVEYLSHNNLGQLPRLAELLAREAYGLALFESLALETHSLLFSCL